MSSSGAPAAYRGYRLQALYTLGRMLLPAHDKSIIFHPEGEEDLSLEHSEKLIEVIQVKSYQNLTLSNLDPANPNSFFHRAATLLKRPSPPEIRLVNFGSIGKEMSLAWKGDEGSRKSISLKLMGHGLNEDSVKRIFEGVILSEVTEEDEEQEVFIRLQDQIAGIDPHSSFDLLNYWLYRKSEARERIQYTDLVEKIQGVGKFLSDRLHYHIEWFTSILPLEDFAIEDDQIAELQMEFYAGVSTRYEHILSNLDFIRSEKLSEIHQAFDESNVVVIHAASGQGKTTLAYRYLHDYFPEKWRFHVQLVENRQHALRIAVALSGYANAAQTPMAIFLDVSSRDTEWPELLRQLAKHPYLQLLVTIREEDFRRANISSSINYIPIDLAFSKNEAELIYDRAIDSGCKITQLNFEETWDAFGGEGPLLEYVYFLTQTQTLHQRLREQVDRIQQEVRDKGLSPDEFRLLQLVSIANAFEARLHLPKLLQILDLPEPTLSLRYYEKEYLIRISVDQQYIGGLHPIRSRILTELLTDPGIYPWIGFAEQVLPIIPEEDVEIFLLHAYLERQEREQILQITLSQHCTSWLGIDGILRFLLWVGIWEYIQDNQQVIEASKEFFGSAWYFIADLNFSDNEAPSIEGWWKKLGDLMPKERQAQIEEIRQRQTPKENAFQYADAWLDSQKERPKDPLTYQDWKAIPEILYWTYRFGYPNKFIEMLSDDELSSSFELLDLREFSELTLAIFLCEQECYTRVVDEKIHQIRARLANEYDIISLETNEEVLSAHFLTYPEEEGTWSFKGLHDQTLDRLQIIRQLFPQYKKYGSQGYGHQLSGIVKHDDTEKSGVLKEYLLPKWTARANGIAVGITRIKYRPNNWDIYLEEMIQIRKGIIHCLNELSTGILRYFGRNKGYDILKLDAISSGNWDQNREHLVNLPALPKTAVDPWGFGQPEGKQQNEDETQTTEKTVPLSVLEQIYKPYLDAKQRYSSSLVGFMQQALHVGVTNFHTGKLPENSLQKTAMLESLKQKNIQIDSGFLSFTNLFEAREKLLEFQRQFRILFGQRVEDSTLSILERNELEVFSRLWPLWYYFSHFPRSNFSNPGKQIPFRINGKLEAIYQGFDEGISNVRDERCDVYRISTDLQWDNGPTIWIQLDVENPMLINEKCEELIASLRETIGRVTWGDLNYILIQENLKYTVILPTVRGKMVSQLVWPLQSVFTIGDDKPIEEKQWAYVQQELPIPMMEKLGINLWQHERIDMVNLMHASVAGLFLVISLLKKISELPDLTNAGKDKLNAFMENRSKDLSDLLHQFTNTSGILFAEINGLDDQEQETRPYFVEAIGLLSEIANQIMPTNQVEEVQKLATDQFEEYTNRLEDLFPIVDHIKSLLVFDIITRI